MLFLTEKQSSALHRLVDVPPDRIVQYPVFPGPRARPAPVPIVGGGLASGGEQTIVNTPSGVALCIGSGGIHAQVANSVGAGVTQVSSTVLFQRPYVIVYVEFMTSPADFVNSRGILKIAQDIDITGGANTSGQQLDEGAIGSADFACAGTALRSYPNRIVTFRPSALKFIFVNGSAGTIGFNFTANLRWLD